MDEDDVQAHITAAIHELGRLKSDIISELGHNPMDLYLKTAFVSYVAAAETHLERALA